MLRTYTTLSPRQQINPAPYATFARTIYRKTVVVKPVGTPRKMGSCCSLRWPASADASASNRYLLKIEPGVYHIGGNSLRMKEFVDIEGSGELVTRIESSGFAESLHGTVITWNDAELRSLTVSCDGGGVDDIALALLNDYRPATLSHVTLEAYNGLSATYGMFNNYLTTVQVDTVTVIGDITTSPGLWDFQ